MMVWEDDTFCSLLLEEFEQDLMPTRKNVKKATVITVAMIKNCLPPAVGVGSPILPLSYMI
jgi:hypothetical protein